MRLHLLSDIHLEVCPFTPLQTDADVVVLAGDISSDPAGAILWARNAFRGKPVVYVPGNHEFYGGHLSKRIIEMKQVATTVEDVFVLDNDELVTGGVRFLGSTLWTDFELFGEAWRSNALVAAKAHMADFSCIFYGSTGYFLPEQSVTLHRASCDWLKMKLHEPFPGPTVVVSHHAPHRGSLAPRFANDLTSAAFVSDLENLMGFSALWMHGHTHTSFDYVVEGTRIVCNPRGYCFADSCETIPPGSPTGSSCENPEFNPGLVLEVVSQDLI